MPRLETERITLSYGGADPAVRDLSLRVPDGAITSIVGPNGCGKSTLLRALARLMSPRSGCALLDGQAIHQQPTKQVASQLGLLPQQPSAPEGITVEDLARRGRYPHQSFLQPPSERDRAAVEAALEMAGMAELRDRPVDELSGGQRQRAWIAMALAQETPIMLLDEPTTYLDMAHQQEVLNLVRRLNREQGRTVVLVLHDVNAAARVSDHVVAMRDGSIFVEGPPREVLDRRVLESVFGVVCDVVVHPETEDPFSVPQTRARPGVPPVQSGASALGAERLSTGYGAALVLEDVTVSPPPGEITAIVGPNACGKSTLLRTLARLLSPVRGDVFLDGRAVSHGKHKDLARRLAWLSQGAATPPGVTVEDLVAVGRYPYQRWYRQWSREDQRAVDAAMDATGVSELRWQPVDTLSGGQRQRVWLAMALAQQTGVLLLDEPTTFLDIAHQVEALDLVWEMNRREGRTVVLVLHDLGQACRYADYIIAMKGGRVVTAGQPQDVVTPSLVREVFDVPCCVVPDPVCGKPLVLPGRDSEDSLLRLREAEEQRAAADHSERDASRTARSYALSG